MLHHEWNWMIVVYLFLGGLGAGSLVLGGAAHLIGRNRYRGIARAGALVAPVLVSLGSGLLIFDLGRPFRFWRLFVTINPVSPMSIGSWLLILFTLIASLYALLHLPPEWLMAASTRMRRLEPALRKLAAWNRPGETESNPMRTLGAMAVTAGDWPDCPIWVKRIRSLLAVAGVTAGIGVGIYTGVLLGAIPARPFWNTPMVAQLFLFSALSTATALLLIITPMLWKGTAEHHQGEHQVLVRADLIFIFLELFIVIPFIVHGELSVLSSKVALSLVMGGPYTTVFWAGVVVLGILIPLSMELVDALGGLRRLPGPMARLLHFIVPVLILVGGYLLRWVFVHAGQDSVFL